MGRRRRQGDDRADAAAAAEATAEQDRRALCLHRWPGIVAAIKTLLAAYNDGAGRQLLTVTEHRQGDDPAITITSAGSVCGAITLAVDGDALLVRTNSAPPGGLHGLTRRIDCSRSDAAAAAYLLQDWMDHL